MHRDSIAPLYEEISKEAAEELKQCRNGEITTFEFWSLLNKNDRVVIENFIKQMLEEKEWHWCLIPRKKKP
jgi:hypothetical protein